MIKKNLWHDYGTIIIEATAGEREMARALSFTPPGSDAQLGFVMTNSRVYTTRVCFPNRGGGGK